MTNAPAIASGTAEERRRACQALRREAPRRSHAGWRPAENRPDPIAILEQQERTRIPELLPLRHGDHATLVDAVSSGRMETLEGV